MSGAHQVCYYENVAEVQVKMFFWFFLMLQLISVFGKFQVIEEIRLCMAL